MSSGTKIGLLLVLILCGLGGYFLYQKLQAPSALKDGDLADAAAKDADSKSEGEDGQPRNDDSSETDGEVTLTAAQVTENDEKSPSVRKKSKTSSDFNFDDESASAIGEGQTEPESDDPFNESSPSNTFERSSGARGEHHRHRSSSRQSSNPILTLDDDEEDASSADEQKPAANDEFASESEGSSASDQSGDSDSPFYKPSKHSGQRYRNQDEANELETTDLSTDENGERPQTLLSPRHQHGTQRSLSPGHQKGFDDSDELASLDDETDVEIKSGRRNHQGNGNRDAESFATDQPVPEEIDDLSPELSHSSRHSMSSSRREHQLRDEDENELDVDDASIQVYVVQESDNFWSIAKNVYGAASYFNALAEFNKDRIPDPQKMRPGMKVLVPPAEVLDRKYPTLVAKKKPSQSGESVHLSGFNATGDGPNGGDVQPAGFFVGPQGRPSYRIGKEDTLSTIAKTHLGRASRWSQIYQLNRQLLPTPHSLQVGMVLELPADASSVVLVNEGTLTR
ncbi:MAG: LysM peptidoglycan-binding domain-containing protein [Planctomycetaceae bacterium]